MLITCWLLAGERQFLLLNKKERKKETSWQTSMQASERTNEQTSKQAMNCSDRDKKGRGPGFLKVSSGCLQFLYATLMTTGLSKISFGFLLLHLLLISFAKGCVCVCWGGGGGGWHVSSVHSDFFLNSGFTCLQSLRRAAADCCVAISNLDMCARVRGEVSNSHSTEE